MRKDFSDKVAEKVKSDSQKTTGEKLTENITDSLDNAAAKLQPDEDKGNMQRAADKTHGAKAEASSYLESAKKEGAKILESAQNLVSQAAGYIHEHTAPASETHSKPTTTTEPPK
jgi:F0F1-type ATP synthase membrane subunit b/b'